MKLDLKFYGEVHKVKDDSIVPEDQWMVFLAKDNAFAFILPIYLQTCKLMNADDEHIKAVERTIVRCNQWRLDNQDKLKVPDAKGEKLLA